MIWFLIAALFVSNALLWLRVRTLEVAVLKLAELACFYAASGGTGVLEFGEIWGKIADDVNGK